jgi:hypothetical protein
MDGSEASNSTCAVSGVTSLTQEYCSRHIMMFTVMEQTGENTNEFGR